MGTLPAFGGRFPIPLSLGDNTYLRVDHFRPLDQGSQRPFYAFRRLHSGDASVCFTNTPLSLGDNAHLRVDHFRSLDQGSQHPFYAFRGLHILEREETKDVLFCMKRRRGGSVSHGSEEVFVQRIALLKSMLAKGHIEHIRSRKVKQGTRILVLRSD